MRKLAGRFNEIDVSEPLALERMRSAPILPKEYFAALWHQASDKMEVIENKLRDEDENVSEI